MAAKFYRLTRDVRPSECHWLQRTHFKGDIVEAFYGHDYGCITPKGTAVTCDDQKTFFELPNSALEEMP
jgi:hypothetical protein